jgi:hypothetical protein
MNQLSNLLNSEEKTSIYKKDIIEAIKRSDTKDIDSLLKKFIVKLSQINSNEIKLLILSEKRYVSAFYYFFSDQNIRKINRYEEQFKIVMKNPSLIQIIIYDTDLLSNLPDFLDFYDNCKIIIPDIDDFILSNYPMFISFYKDEQLKEMMSLEEGFIDHPIHFNTFSHREHDLDPQPIEPKNYFINLNEDKKYPNIIFDLHDDTETCAYVLREYRLKIVANIHQITMNRVYRCQLDDRIFYIQILFNDIKKMYNIFIFEYFENYDFVKSKFKLKVNKLIDKFMSLIKKPIYMCVAYRDITIELTDDNEKIFVENNSVFVKDYKYYGKYLMTSSIYQKQNILSLLFLLYGLILNDIELIYTKNKYGMEYNELFICKLINATKFKHTQCPYCKLGFRLAKMKIPTNKYKNITNLDLYQPETKQLIQSNDKLYYINDEFYLENFNLFNPRHNLVGDSEEHYFNPSLHNMFEFMYDKIIQSRPSLTKSIVLDTDLLQNIRNDIERLPNKHLLNSFYMDRMENYNQHQKEELIKSFYRKSKNNNN